MTHEQKPESAEFRTREEIEMEMVRLLTHGVRGPNAAMQVVHRIFDEVRAFGALEEQSASRAEQRRKDAEGAGPVGYASPGGLKQLASGKGASIQNIYRHPDNSWPIPLYTAPANVAALEDRVKELEAVTKAALEWIDAVPEGTRAALPTMPGFDRDWADNVVAAIREGEQS